jgi:acyl dehydratase
VTRVLASTDELRSLVGERLGTGDWLVVDQARIDGFAAVTGDDQWIHVDPVRAASGPFGTTVAHGWLTASLIPVLVRGIYRVEGVRSAVNYGSDRVRFPAPVPVGSRIRASLDLEAVDDVAGGVQLTNAVTVERDGGDRPVCVARVLSRLLT